MKEQSKQFDLDLGEIRTQPAPVLTDASIGIHS